MSVTAVAWLLLFLMADVLFLRMPAGVREPRQVRRIFVVGGRGEPNGTQTGLLNYPEFRTLQQTVASYGTVGAYTTMDANFASRAVSGGLTVAAVTDNYFEVLGVRAVARGTRMAPSQDGTSAILSESFWRNRLGAPVAGSVFRINGHPVRIAGVAADGFVGIDLVPIDVWVPLSALPEIGMSQTWQHETGTRILDAIARPHPDTPVEHLQAAARQAGAASASEIAIDGERRRFVMSSLRAGGQSPGRSGQSMLMLLLAAFGAAIFVVAAMNFAGLALARNAARAGEFRMRAFLGGGRLAVLSPILVESGLQAAIGTLLAVISVVASRGIIIRSLAIEMPTVMLSARFAAFALVSLFLLMLGIAALPAMMVLRQARQASIRTSTSAIVYQRPRYLSVIQVVQAAGTFVLLVIAIGVSQRLDTMLHREFGMPVERLVAVSMESIPRSTAAVTPTIEQQAEMFWRAASAVGASAEVLASAATTTLPLQSTTFTLVGPTARAVEDGAYGSGTEVAFGYVEPAFFAITDLQPEVGRTLEERDAQSGDVAVVNRALATRLWPGRRPLGQCVWSRDDGVMRCHRVVGVVRTSRYLSLAESAQPFLYLALDRRRPPSRTMHVIARTRGDGERGALDIMRRVTGSVPGLALLKVRPYTAIVKEKALAWRLSRAIISALACMAVGLAMLGAYGTLSYAVVQRTREIGLRLALGATPGRLLREFLASGARAPVAGALTGALVYSSVAVITAKATNAFLEVSLSSVAGAFAMVMLSAIAACLIPSLRGVRLSPSEALREERL